MHAIKKLFLQPAHQQRQSLPDLLKGFAVLFMVQVHITELLAVESWFFSKGGSISLFLGGVPAAPVFMTVMGYFLAKGNKPTTALLKHGGKLLGWGLMLNLGMNAHLLLKYFSGTLNVNPWTYVLGVDILFLAGFSVLIIASLRKVLNNNILLWLLAMVFFASANPYLPVFTGEPGWVKYLQAFINGYYHWSYFPVFPWAGYPLAGYVAFHLLNKKTFHSATHTQQLILAGVLLLVLIVSFRFGLRNSVLLQVYYHHSFMFFMWAIAFVLLWAIVVKLLFSGAHGFVFDWIRWVGKNVTVFYVLQWLLIGNLATSLYKSQFPISLLGWFLGITLVVIVLVLGWLRLKAILAKKN